MSAPTPCVRSAVSWTMPWVKPTTKIISTTSTATAVTDRAVRTGRISKLATIIRLTNGAHLFCQGCLLQVNQLRSRGLFQEKFVIVQRLVELNLGDGQDHSVVILGTVQDNLSRVRN